MVAGLPKGYALKMLKKWSKNGEKMVAGRPVTIFIAFSFEFFTNREPKVGAAAEGRRPHFGGRPKAMNKNKRKMLFKWSQVCPR